MKILNTLKQNLKVTVYLLITLFALQGCSGDDGDKVEKPTVNYSATTIDATFYESGNSAPTIDWNGNTGTLNLVESYEDGIQGLTINETTGELSWTKFLKEGIWIFDVEATNSAGTTIVEMTLDNRLKGVFTGTFVYSGMQYFYEMDFSKDGTVEVRSGSTANPDISTGTWTINNNDEVIVNYFFSSSADEYSSLGALTQTDDNASYSGDWYYGYEAIDGNQGGTFDIIKGN